MADDHVQNLIDRSNDLELRASRAQGARDFLLDAEAFRLLADDYHRWFGDTLRMLPTDLADRFRTEYEGRWYAQKIKQFLEAGDKRNDLFQEPEEGRPPVFPFWRAPFDSTFRPAILAQRQVLIEAAARLPESTATTAAVTTVERIGRRFSAVARQVAQPRRAGPGLVIESEYDMQHLLHGLLLVHFDDVRPEDPASRFAGASSRLDFLLKRERVVVEAKFMRESMTTKDVGEQLLTDIGRYQTHPDCGAIVAIVYDPNFRIANPRELETDLTGASGKLRVVVVAAQG